MANDDQAIRNLISVLRDSEKGFVDVGEHITTPEYKNFFMAESKVRGSYATQIERAVNFTTDADVHETGTAAGALHRFWGNVKGHLGGGDHTLLETAEQGEDTALKAYREALDDTAVSDTIRAAIAEQYEHVRECHNRIKRLRDTATIHA